MQYLRQINDTCWMLDHRIAPEVRAMFAAMVSRMPQGGIQVRYKQVLDAVQAERGTASVQAAEESLTTYPLPPKVQEFFDTFVSRYGHSSIMELTGSPTVFVENVSWYTNWILFDSPLVMGQEFSTRAVQHKDWGLAQECYRQTEGGEPQAVPELEELHKAWLLVFDAEVNWWAEHLEDPTNRANLGIADKEPFRPALDRARWALPGSIATGCALTSPLRERARAIHAGLTLQPRSRVWAGIKEAYRAALPGMAGMGLRETVYYSPSDLPWHLQSLLQKAEPNQQLSLQLLSSHSRSVALPRRVKPNSYIDPSYNQNFQVQVTIPCSLAVARDWHRHRTLCPWQMQLDRIQIDPHYAPMSEYGQTQVARLLERTDEIYSLLPECLRPLCLPLGAKVVLQASGGLRDALYMLELRSAAHGANFEYKEQATALLRMLRKQVGESLPIF